MSTFLDAPFEPDIDRLPRWARVAFAVRCAQRVEPVFRSTWPDAPREHRAMLRKTLTMAAAVAASGDGDAEALRDFSAQLGQIASSTFDADVPPTDPGSPPRTETACWVAVSAMEAAEAAIHALMDSYDVGFVRQSFERAMDAASHRRAGLEAECAMKQDFDALVARADAGSWDDDTPVDPSLLDDLWPEGKPPRWPGLGQHMSKKRQQELSVLSRRS